jgi:hypothetical protein
VKLLRAILLSLLFSLLVGLVIGTVIRLKLERPVRYIGALDAGLDSGSQPPRLVHSTSPTPARAFSSRANTKSRSDSRLM